MLQRDALDDGRLADARVADEERVVLAAAREDLDGAVDLVLAADQRIDAALGGFLPEVDAVRRERILRRVAPPRPPLPRLRSRPGSSGRVPRRPALLTPCEM